MHYLIDGYNLLFHLFDSPQVLQSRREKVIQLLEESLFSLDLPVTLIFDASSQGDNRPAFEYFKSFDVLFTPRGLTADEYILEKVEFCLHPAELTIVTSDQRLAMQCRHLGAYTQTLKQFLAWLEKKQTNKKSPPSNATFQDSKPNIERLLKIFESKLRDESD